ncbi:hypothetical protein LCGC14_2649850 [marine sediment metagenome]|uniref:Uncharacterized protein n=1 Tax=marine sediment metagenome TaxID=412755 RepID=A0A0F8ZV06_9ZZZZ
MKCDHCIFIEKTFSKILQRDDSTNREYWIMTEVFFYLHNSDICRKSKKSIKKES